MGPSAVMLNPITQAKRAALAPDNPHRAILPCSETRAEETDMRSILCSLFLLCGLIAQVPVANARYCNAGHGCAINCEGTCGCIYRRDEKTCDCWCEGGSQPQDGKYSLDFNGTSWGRIGEVESPLDVLRRILGKDVIDCLDKRGGDLTLSTKSASPKELSEQFSRFCQ